MYLDTAIIIKLLVAEPDTEFFQNALENELLSSSELALTEVWSALLAKDESISLPALLTASGWLGDMS